MTNSNEKCPCGRKGKKYEVIICNGCKKSLEIGGNFQFKRVR